MIDPIEALIASRRSASDQNFEFYTEKLKGIVNAYRLHMNRQDRDVLLNLMVKALMDGDNTREDLCYMLITAIDREARG